MLPQELMQLPPRTLIVLKAGVPAIRGRKIVYFQEALFRRRLRPAPTPQAPPLEAEPVPPIEEDPMDFDVIARAFAAESLPPPAPGAGEAEVADWLDKVVDATPSEAAS